MTSQWTRERINAELERVAQSVEKSVTAYLAGGGAMVVQGVKDRTRDIDLVVPSERNLLRVQRAVSSAGYARTVLQADGDETVRMCQFQGEDGGEIDIFNTQIADGMILSDGICRRSNPYIMTPLADISVISLEDIYLSKLVHGGRVKDTPDTTALSKTALDFEVIRGELSVQNDLADGELPSLLLFEQSNEE